MKTTKLLVAFILIFNLSAKSQIPFFIGSKIDDIKKEISQDPSFKILEDISKEKLRNLYVETHDCKIDFLAVSDTVYCNSIVYIFKTENDIDATIKQLDYILGKNNSNVWSYTDNESRIKIDAVFYDYNCSNAIIFDGYSF